MPSLRKGEGEGVQIHSIVHGKGSHTSELLKYLYAYLYRNCNDLTNAFNVVLQLFGALCYTRTDEMVRGRGVVYKEAHLRINCRDLV